MNEDMSNLFDKFNINKDSISPDMINNLMNMLGNTSNHNSQESNSTYSQNSYETSRK